MQIPPLISLCMIVRNEARFLPVCLQSIRDVVDEIIVVDTGSSDESPAIARNLGAQVFSFSWNDDFAEARNFCLQKATGEWILVLDADEQIAERDRRKIVDLTTGEVDGYRFTYRSYSQNSCDVRWIANDGSYEEGNGWDGWISGRVVRLFKRNERVCFIGAVHETVDSSIIALGGKVGSSGIIIHHFHEKKGKERLREKQLQYLRLCEKNLESLPKNPKTYFDMGVIQRHVLNDCSRAMALQEKALALNPDYLDARMELAALYHLQNDSARAAKELAVLLDKTPSSAPAWLLCGIILERRGKMERAIECYERAASLNPHLIDARLNLGALLAKQGKFEQAREQWVRASELNPANAKILLNLGALELRAGNHVSAREYFEKALAVSPENAPAWNNLGVLNANLGNIEQAKKAFERALALDPARGDVRRNLAALDKQAVPLAAHHST